MRRKRHNRILGRTANQRLHLMRNLTSSLLEHGTIVTTQAKAKELRSHLEPLITQARLEPTLPRRRQLRSKLGQAKDLAVLLEVAKKHEKRPGGYLRVTKLVTHRADSAEMAKIEIL